MIEIEDENGVVEMDTENKKFSRRKFVKIAGGIIAGAAGLYTFLPGMRAWPQQVVDSAKAIARHYLPMGGIDALSVRQIITQDSSNSRTIMWQSELVEKDAVVEYRRKGNEDIKSSLATDEEFADDKRMTYIHTTVLKDLAAGAQYEYRVGYDDKRSDWHDLSTDDGGTFKALIFPDSQSNDYSDWKNLAQFAKRENPDVAFFVNMGDLVDNGEDHTQWRAWFDSLNGIIDTIPVVPLLGNHETYNQDWKVRMPKAYLHLFCLPANGDAERRRDRLYNFQPDTRGPLYIVTGVAGNVRYPNLWVNHPFDKAVAPQPETDNYMTLEVTGNTLKLASFLPFGERIDQVEIAKN